MRELHVYDLIIFLKFFKIALLSIDPLKGMNNNRLDRGWIALSNSNAFEKVRNK